jgi:two-component system chemotaxis response regulator CheY
VSDVFILIVEDEREVRDAIERDIEVFTPAFRIEVAEDAADARSAMEDCAGRGDRVALVLADHLLPGEQGTDFLIALHQDPETRSVRKVLITGQAGHEDTIRAINEADLDHYIAKPWQPDELQRVVRNELTDWVIANEEDVLAYVAVLDGPRLMETIRDRPWRH